jgi:hypothetical protein
VAGRLQVFLSGRSVDAFSWHRDLVVVSAGSAGPTARPYGGQMDGSGCPSPTQPVVRRPARPRDSLLRCPA